MDEEHGGNSTILPINSSIQNFMEYNKESASSEDTVNTPPSSKSFEWSAPLSDLTKNSSSSSSSSILKRTILDNERSIQIHIARIEFLNDELNLADALGLDISEINTITKEIEYLNKSMIKANNEIATCQLKIKGLISEEEAPAATMNIYKRRKQLSKSVPDLFAAAEDLSLSPFAIIFPPSDDDA